MEGNKHDTGKDPWHLMPLDALRGIVRVLAFGANKYTQTSLGNLWDAVKPVAFDLVTAKGCVARITRNSYGQPILTLPNASGQIDETGNGETQIVCKTWLAVDESLRNLGLEMRPPSGDFTWLDTASPQSRQTSTYEEAVRFAEASDTFTLITTTRQGNSEVFCAVSTTTAWDSLAMTLKVLRPLCATSVLWKLGTGNRNWEKGMAWSRCYSALQRHMVSWWMKEDGGKDPETGYSHLWHAGACILFLIAFELRGIGEDDRP